MPPDPPRCLRLRRSRGALRRQENIHVRCFQKYVRYFTKQLKTLTAMWTIIAPLGQLAMFIFVPRLLVLGAAKRGFLAFSASGIQGSTLFAFRLRDGCDLAMAVFAIFCSRFLFRHSFLSGKTPRETTPAAPWLVRINSLY